jgi:hypothetical protein
VRQTHEHVVYLRVTTVGYDCHRISDRARDLSRLRIIVFCALHPSGRGKNRSARRWRKLGIPAAHSTWRLRVLADAFASLVARCSRASVGTQRSSLSVLLQHFQSAMILALRQRHRQAFIALGAFVPVIFAVGITVRTTPPVNAALPTALEAMPQSYKKIGQAHTDLFAKVSLQVGFLREIEDPAHLAINIADGRDFVKPDLLVYWAEGTPTVTGTVPDNAVLLGTFGSKVFALPAQAAQSEGILLLYSLADGEIVDVSKPFLPSTAAVLTR